MWKDSRRDGSDDELRERDNPEELLLERDEDDLAGDGRLRTASLRLYGRQVTLRAVFFVRVI